MILPQPLSETPNETSSKDAFDELAILDDESTNPSFGCKPELRPIREYLRYGVVKLDKPSGPTSHEVVAWVKRLLQVEKAGHSGTLDPAVTGLLPIGLDQSTKSLSVLLLQPKEYLAVIRLHEQIDENSLNRVFSEFHGPIYQRPPQRSSVKRMTRTRHVYEMDILERNERLLLVRVLCEAGTYIRKLAYDMGEALGPGATMVELRRTKVSHMSEEDGFVRLHDLAYAKHLLDEKGDESPLRSLVHPVEYVTRLMKSLIIRDSAVDAVCHGAQLAVPGVLRISPNMEEGDKVAIYTIKGELIGIGESRMRSDDVLSAEKGIVASPSRIIMKAETYPRLWKQKSPVEN